jgi:hypothetical protein
MSVSLPKVVGQNWNPPGRHTRFEIMKLFQEGTINRAEKDLLTCIDMLVEEFGICLGGNDYLANQIATSTSHTVRMITRLRRFGLLVSLRFDGRNRYLKTQWPDSVSSLPMTRRLSS